MQINKKFSNKPTLVHVPSKGTKVCECSFLNKIGTRARCYKCVYVDLY